MGDITVQKFNRICINKMYALLLLLQILMRVGGSQTFNNSLPVLFV